MPVFEQQKNLPSAVSWEISNDGKSAFYGLNGVDFVNRITFLRVSRNLQISPQNARKLARR